MIKKFMIVLMLVLMVLSAVGCTASQADEGGAPAADSALKVTGLVDNEMGWTDAQVRAMESIEAQKENKAGEMESFTGVALNALLDKAGVKGEAASVVFVASDGYEAELSLDEVRACSDCIVAFNEDGGFSMALPGFPGNVQVKDVIEIQVK